MEAKRAWVTCPKLHVTIQTHGSQFHWCSISVSKKKKRYHYLFNKLQMSLDNHLFLIIQSATKRNFCILRKMF